MAKAKSYPKGASLSGLVPQHQRSIIGVDVGWVYWNGSRAQRRRLARALQRQERRKG